MFGALLRSTLPSLRSISAKGPSFGSLSNYPRSAMCFRTESPLSLMGSVLREKSCLKTNKSAAKRFIVRGNGRIKRWELISSFIYISPPFHSCINSHTLCDAGVRVAEVTILAIKGESVLTSWQHRLQSKKKRSRKEWEYLFEHDLRRTGGGGGGWCSCSVSCDEPFEIKRNWRFTYHHAHHFESIDEH
jgi:hypothetical protein